MKKILLFLTIVLSIQVHAMEAGDSLLTALKSASEDTNKVNILISLSRHFLSSNPTEAIHYGEQAKSLAQKLNFHYGLAQAYKRLGLVYYMQGNYLQTLDYWDKSLEEFRKIKDKNGEANIINNIGTVYYDQTDETKALEYFLKSLKLSEELKDTIRISTALCNIGNVYNNKEKRSTWDKGLDYYFRGLDLSTKVIDQKLFKNQDDYDVHLDLIGSFSVGIGEIYFNKGEDKKAIEYFEKSLKAYEGTEAYPYSLNAIGKVFTKDGEIDKALKKHNEAYNYAVKLDAKLDMVQSLLGIAKAYEATKDYPKAITYFHNAANLADTLGSQLELKDAYLGLAKSYAKIKDYDNAYSYQAKLTDIKDTLYNISTDKKMASLQFDFDIEKKQGQIDLMTKDKELQDLYLKRQKAIKNATIGGLLVVMSFLIVVFFQKKRIAKEKQRSDELLLNILPEETAEELKATGTAKAKSIDKVTVMFTDFKNFTQASELLSAEELVSEINYCYSEFDKIITKFGIEKIKTIGDSYMCAGGLPVANNTHPVDVIKAGLEMQAFILANKERRKAKGEPFFELRLGIHTGPVVAGIVGIKKFAYDIWGDTVNTASRMESSGEIGKVNISGTTHELVKDKFIFKHRGMIEAKNKGVIEMYFVEGII